MKKLYLLWILFFIFSIQITQAQFKRLAHVNKDIFKEFEVKKYKESHQFSLPNKSEYITTILSLTDNAVIIKTNQVKKNPDGKGKITINRFYEYDFFVHSLRPITDISFSDSLNQLIANSYIEIKRGSFDKQEAKEIHKEVSKEVGKGLVEIFTDVDIPDEFKKDFKIFNIFSDSYATVHCKYLAYGSATTDVESVTYTFKNPERKYDATFKMNKLKPHNKLQPFYPFMDNFHLTANGIFIQAENCLFDLERRRMYVMFNYWKGRHISFNRNCTFIILITQDIMRKNIVIDAIPIQESFTQELMRVPDTSIRYSETGSDANSFVDERDNQVYRWIELGGQTWMAENLNLGQMIFGKQKQDDNRIIEKYCYDNREENCDTYGGLYQWNEVMDYSENIQGICPDGWHVPSIEEWNVLINYLGGKKTAGSLLKEVGMEHWEMSKKAQKKYASITGSGFDALPGGYRSKATRKFGALGLIGFLRNSTNGAAYGLYGSETLIKKGPPDTNSGYSVRCIKN